MGDQPEKKKIIEETEDDENFLAHDDIDEVIELNEDIPSDDDDDEHMEADAKDEDEQLEEMVDVIDESISQFTEHGEPVLCCDVSKDDRFVVTGGQDDKACVWDASTQKCIFQIHYKDSVVAAKFNANSTLIATGAYNGEIQVHDLSGQMCYDFEVTDLNWMLWHPIAENVLLAGTTSGDAWMWKLSKTNPQCRTFQSYGYQNMCAKMFSDGKRILMGYEDGSIRIWDLKETKVIYTITENSSHEDSFSGSVICLDVNSDDSLIAAGSLNSTVKIINANNGKVVMTISTGITKSEDETDSIESIAFSGKNLLAIGSLNGIIEIWDVPTQTKRNELKLDFGVSKITVDKTNANILYCGCLDSYFRVIDLRSCEVILTKSGHTDRILDFSVSSDSKYALTCSDDATCKIFSLNK